MLFRRDDFWTCRILCQYVCCGLRWSYIKTFVEKCRFKFQSHWIWKCLPQPHSYDYYYGGRTGAMLHIVLGRTWFGLKFGSVFWRFERSLDKPGSRFCFDGETLKNLPFFCHPMYIEDVYLLLHFRFWHFQKCHFQIFSEMIIGVILTFLEKIFDFDTFKNDTFENDTF